MHDFIHSLSYAAGRPAAAPSAARPSESLHSIMRSFNDGASAHRVSPKPAKHDHARSVSRPAHRRS